MKDIHTILPIPLYPTIPPPVWIGGVVLLLGVPNRHATRQKQDEATATVGSSIEQVISCRVRESRAGLTCPAHFLPRLGFCLVFEGGC